MLLAGDLGVLGRQCPNGLWVSGVGDTLETLSHVVSAKSLACLLLPPCDAQLPPLPTILQHLLLLDQHPAFPVCPPCIWGLVPSTSWLLTLHTTWMPFRSSLTLVCHFYFFPSASHALRINLSEPGFSSFLYHVRHQS